MLRVGMPGGAPTAPPDQEDAVSQPAVMADPSQQPPTDDPTSLDQDELNLPKLDPSVVAYMGPENGPFMCSNCVYFEDSGACHLVSGPIDPNGCCSVFTSKGAGQAPPEEADMTAPPEAEESTDVPPDTGQ